MIKLAFDWLCKGRNGRWLLILDNIDSAELLSEAGNTGQGVQGAHVSGELWEPMTAHLARIQNGSILVTSRSQAVGLKLVEKKDIFPVQPMTQAQALTLLEKKLGPLDRDHGTKELATELEFVPLAIVQAAAYISQRAPRYSTKQYLQDFRRNERKKTSLLNHEGGHLRRDWQAHSSILNTWQISFEHIERSRPSAANLLSLMSFFDRQGIPEVLVRNRVQSKNGHAKQEEAEEHTNSEEVENDDDASTCSEEDGFEDDIQILRDYSFVSVDTDQTFEMHALVQLATRKWLEANGQLEAYKQRYIKTLSTEFPTGTYENWMYCRMLFPHAKLAITQRPTGEESLKKWAFLLYKAAWYACEKGSIVEAIELSELAMKVRENILGQEHKRTLASMSMVCSAYILGGRWKEAEKIEVYVMESSKRLLGEEHLRTLKSTSDLALIYWNQGRWKEAAELGMHVIESSKKSLGEEHPGTLISMSNLALTYLAQERYEKAENLELQIIERQKRVLNEEHPDTLASICNLALIYYGQKRWQEAEKLEIHVVKSRKRVLGDEHPATLTSIANLAVTYQEQGRWKESEQLEMQETTKRVLGEEHPATLTSINNLACSLKRRGQKMAAISLMESCVQLQKRILGPEHPHTEASLRALNRWKSEEESESEEGLQDESEKRSQDESEEELRDEHA